VNVLITGAAGKAGRAIRAELAGRHEMRLLDIAEIEHPEGEVVKGDVSDLDTVKGAMAGMDGVIHLAFSRRSLDAHFDVNVKATYYVLQAAKDEGAKKVVYASTLSIYDGHPTLRQQTNVSEDTPAWGQSLYGLSKYMGEMAVKSFGDAHGLSAIALRLTGLKTREEWAQDIEAGRTSLEECRGSTLMEDVARAFRLALEVEGVGFGVYNICGDNPGRMWDISRAREALGFWPEFRFVAD